MVIVTIGVCVKDGSSTLRAAIDSIIDQDFSIDRQEN
jgi:hypothetical protein